MSEAPPPSGGGYGAPPPPPPGGDYGGQAPRTEPKAVWALVLGILGILCCSPAGIAALVVGKMSQNAIDASGGVLQGRGMATAGFVLGIVSVVFLVIGVLLFATGVLTFDGTFDTTP